MSGISEPVRALCPAPCARPTGKPRCRQPQPRTPRQIGGQSRGASFYGNNFYYEDGTLGGALPGYACDDPGFYQLGGNCVFDFNAVAANEASVTNKSLFARGQWHGKESW